MALPAIHSNGMSLEELNALPCFQAIEKIEAIATGYSQSCAKVIDGGQSYFVKKFAGGNSSLEQTARNERLFSNAAGNAGISPQVFYQDSNYLVCAYIDGEVMSASTLAMQEKLHLALGLMTSCHQLKLELPVLDMAAVVAELTAALSPCGRVTAAHLGLLKALTDKISLEITPGPLYPCHGDINFSNILLARSTVTVAQEANDRAAWLIDFECCALAEKEFDLAMLIAVNEIPYPEMLALLQQGPFSSFLSHGRYSGKLQLYLAFCYLINALWYLVYQLESGDSQFAPLARRQFALLDELNMLDGSFGKCFADFYPGNEISC